MTTTATMQTQPRWWLILWLVAVGAFLAGALIAGPFYAELTRRYEAEQAVLAYERQVTPLILLAIGRDNPKVAQLGDRGVPMDPARLVLYAQAQADLATALTVPVPAGYDATKAEKLRELIVHLQSIDTAQVRYEQVRATGQIDLDDLAKVKAELVAAQQLLTELQIPSK